jgi:hypothetical protein
MKLIEVRYLTVATLATGTVFGAVSATPLTAKAGQQWSPVPEHQTHSKPMGNHGNPKPPGGGNHGGGHPTSNHNFQANPTIYGPTVSPSFNPNNTNSAVGNGGNVGDVKSNSNSGGNTLNNGNHINLNGGSNTFNPNNTNNVSPHVQGGGGGNATTGPVNNTNTNHLQGGSATTGNVTNGGNNVSITNKPGLPAAPPIFLPNGGGGSSFGSGTTVSICGTQISAPGLSRSGGITSVFGGVAFGSSQTGKTGNLLVGAALAQYGLTRASQSAYQRAGMNPAEASEAALQRPECNNSVTAPAPVAPAVPVQIMPSVPPAERPARPVAPVPGRISN